MSEIDPGAGHPGSGRPPSLPPGLLPEGYMPLQRGATAGVTPPAPSPPGVGPGDGPFLDRPGVPPTTKSRAWRWFLYAIGGFLVGQLAAAIFGEVAGLIAGKSSLEMKSIVTATVPPEWYVVSTLVGLWVGFLGAPLLASWTQGTRHFLSDLGVRFRLVDAWGLAIGILGQIVIVLIYRPFQHDIHDFNGPSQKLTGASHGAGFLVIAVLTVVVVPFMEELFFRGLLLKALVRLCTPANPGSRSGSRSRAIGVVLAVVIDGLLFGLAHGEWVQLAGLALFGMALAATSYRTGRLGMNVVAHGSFNLVAILSIAGWLNVIH